MEEITLLSRTIQVDIDQLAKGLAEAHQAKIEWHMAFKMGMLQSQLVMFFEKSFTASMLSQFSSVALLLYEDEINQFISDCIKKVIKRIYHFADLDV